MTQPFTKYIPAEDAVGRNAESFASEGIAKPVQCDNSLTTYTCRAIFVSYLRRSMFFLYDSFFGCFLLLAIPVVSPPENGIR